MEVLDELLVLKVLAFCSLKSLATWETLRSSRERQSAEYASYWLRLLHGQADVSDVSRDPRAAKAAKAAELRGIKAAFAQLSVSRASNGGWKALSIGELEECSLMAHRLHLDYGEGRRLFDAEGRCIAQVQRVGLTHFDVQGCFADDDWHNFLESVRDSEWRPLWQLRPARSEYLEVFDTLLSFGLITEGHPAFHGFAFMPDMSNLVWRAEGHRQFLHVVMTLFCGGIQRRCEAYMGPGDEDVLDQHIGYFQPWHVAPFWVHTPSNFEGLHQSVNLEMRQMSIERPSSRWHCVQTMDAEWNEHLDSTPFCPTIFAGAQNPFATLPFEAGLFEGSIALIRQGGGCDFAHKACAARDAGAVGCIIWSTEPILDLLSGPMVRTFQGQESPDPGIPCVLISDDAGRRVHAALDQGPLYVQIRIDRNESFQAFRENVAQGHRVRVAMLAEYISAKPGMGGVDFQEYFFRNM